MIQARVVERLLVVLQWRQDRSLDDIEAERALVEVLDRTDIAPRLRVEANELDPGTISWLPNELGPDGHEPTQVGVLAGGEAFAPSVALIRTPNRNIPGYSVGEGGGCVKLSASLVEIRVADCRIYLGISKDRKR